MTRSISPSLCGGSSIALPAATPAKRGANGAGFTLVEVLIAMLLIGTVMPLVMQGITTATGIAATARRRTEAAGLAQSKMAELVVGQGWQSNAMSGSFGPDWPGYQWQAVVNQWTGSTSTTTGVTMQQLDVTVSWIARNQVQSVTVSSLVYTRPTASSGT